MEKKYDVIALGELLIDFTMNGQSEQGNNMFEACPGGAPCNVLALLNKMGKKTAFIGKVGRDQFGTLLKNTITEAGIDAAHLVVDENVNTTLAFVHTFPDGDREFSFYRDPGADMMLNESEVDEAFIGRAKIFHFGSLSLTGEPVRSATQKAVTLARESGAVISFDPNLRPPLWEDMDSAREQIQWGLAQCDVLKISDDELLFMTGEADFDMGVSKLRNRYPNLRLINVTAGAQGSYAYYKDLRVFQPGLRLGGVIETTGAGDTFCACVLNFLLECGLEGLAQESISQMLQFANTAAYLVTTRRGAIRSMPELEQIQSLL